jgi:hypothetical protein
MHLWDVQIDDKLVTDAKYEISETLRENIDVIDLALEVYNDYLFILKEKERIEEFLKKEPFDKNQFQAEIDKYMETINKIKDEMPFEIRCNMFLIVCSDINNTLCENCEELISMILFKTQEHVFSNLAQKIYHDVKTIKEDLAVKATDSKLLVEFERKLDKIRTDEKQRLMDEYHEVIEWLMMLYRNPRYKLDVEFMKPVTIAFTYINEIVSIIDQSENKLKNERLEIENHLEDQKKTFVKDLAALDGEVLEFKDYDILRKAEIYMK